MKTRILRSLPVALALVLAVAGVAVAASLLTTSTTVDLAAGTDDDGTPDQGSGDVLAEVEDEAPEDEAPEDEAPENETPEDEAPDDGARVRTRIDERTDGSRLRIETREEDGRSELRIRERTEDGEVRIRERVRDDDADDRERVRVEGDDGLRTETRVRDDRIEVRQEVFFAAGSMTFTATFAGQQVGTVEVHRDGGTLMLGTVSASTGWSARIKQDSGREVEVSFRDGTGQRVDLEAEIQNSEVVKWRNRERLD